MKKLLFLFTLLAAMFIAGCGGSDGRDIDPVDQFLDSYRVAFENEDVVYYGTLISPSYLQECLRKSDLVQAANDIFIDPRVTNIRVEFRGGVAKDINYTLGFASFSTTLRLSYDYDGVPTFEDFDFTNVLRTEGFAWRLFGDQSCVLSSGEPKIAPRAPF